MELDNDQNPYSPPQSKVDETPILAEEHTYRVYSPTQGSFGTFLGGPLPGIYFLKSNYEAMGDSEHSRSTLIWGALIFVVFVLLAPFTPERAPKYVVPLVMAWTIRILIEKKQLSKAQIATSDRYRFHSNWKVFGFSLLGALITGVLVVGMLFLYFSLGILPNA